MSVDYQVLEYRDSAPIREVGIFTTSPFTLDIKGSGFTDVAVVTINGVRSPEFIVLSGSRILAQVPRSQVSSAIEGVVVFVATGRLQAKSVIDLQAVVTAGKRASGFTHLVQSFLKTLLTTPGSDIFSPSSGGGLLPLVGSIGTSGDILARSKNAVAAAASQLITKQTMNTRLNNSEKLQAAELLSATFSSTTGTVDLRIKLTALDGSTSSASLSL